MSGIFGLFNEDGAPVDSADLRRMASLLTRRGPSRTGIWSSGFIGLGHTLLATTPESAFERLPLQHGPSGCVITADVRLDNREELLPALGLADRATSTGDAELILAAYLAWDAACVGRLLGDFAFAIWDPRQRRLFCARDHFGIRPFYYHHSPGRFLALASEPRAILVLPQTPYRVNEGRIADFLVQELESIDKTSTFYETIYRLPSAHALTATPHGICPKRFWSLEPGPEIHLESEGAYAEAFLDVFTDAVRCRLRGAGSVGSMLSGGMDSGAIVAVARILLAEGSSGPLRTYSATSPHACTCVETRTIESALTMENLEPNRIHHGQLSTFLPELGRLALEVQEPFDYHMTLPMVLYVAASRCGIKALLDGIDGDLVLSDGSYVGRLLRSGHWLDAYMEAVGQNRFYGGAIPAWRELHRSARTAFVPDIARRWYRRLVRSSRMRSRLDRIGRESLISQDFAHAVSLPERLLALDNNRASAVPATLCAESASMVDHPNLSAGVERYGRVSSSVGVEPRHPFLDRRVVAFCVRLPGREKLRGGWPKAILRRAMRDRLPEAVRWRRGKEHLGWAFVLALLSERRDDVRSALEANVGIISPYVDQRAVEAARESYFGARDDSAAQKVLEAYHLGAWLQDHRQRPRAQLDSTA